MDQSILYFLNGMVGKWPFVDGLAKFLINGSLVIIPLLVLLVFLFGVFLKKERYRTAAVNAACVVLLCLLIGFIIERFTFEVRPMFSLDDMVILMSHTNDSSFPSDHMLLCFGAAFGLWRLSKGLSITTMVFGLLVGLAKIFAAQHYPSDILFTILVALAIYLLYAILLRKLVTKVYQAIDRHIFPKPKESV